MLSRDKEPEYDPRERFVLYRLCDCPTCEGKGKAAGHDLDPFGKPYASFHRCPDCRGEGRQRQEVATCATPEALGVALVTLGREGEFADCPIGVLDRMPECPRCEGTGNALEREGPCSACRGSGIKPTGTWIVKPWTPSARNVSDAARTLARSKKASQSS